MKTTRIPSRHRFGSASKLTAVSHHVFRLCALIPANLGQLRLPTYSRFAPLNNKTKLINCLRVNSSGNENEQRNFGRANFILLARASIPQLSTQTTTMSSQPAITRTNKRPDIQRCSFYDSISITCPIKITPPQKLLLSPSLANFNGESSISSSASTSQRPTTSASFVTVFNFAATRLLLMHTFTASEM